MQEESRTDGLGGISRPILAASRSNFRVPGMSSDISKSSLLTFLSLERSEYFAKAMELRDNVEKWLAYIPATFPHYTCHAVRHSDEIVHALSSLLFDRGHATHPRIPNLSPTEAYILVASAYLHDAGMTVSIREKVSILESGEWKEWVGCGTGANRFAAIELFRNSNRPADGTVRNFLADVQLRYLIAEFVRRAHHERAADVIEQHEIMLGRFAFGDPMLAQTIASACVGHGLRSRDLIDDVRYPRRRDIRGDCVDVRLMAMLLRVGDLLDMSENRACPLLLGAASPLPPDSLAHWSQYGCIKHKLVAPDVIEIRAECGSQQEHRLLQDWCDWLVGELDALALCATRSPLHLGWVPPRSGYEGPSPAIQIVPSAQAKYVPSKWQFEIDADAVIQRLTRDVSPSDFDFVRELIQNAADASRCRLIADLACSGQSAPISILNVDVNIRARYAINMALPAFVWVAGLLWCADEAFALRRASRCRRP